MSHKILICGAVHPEGIELLSAREAFQVDVFPDLNEDRLSELIADYHALIIRGEVRVTDRTLSNAASLRLIARAGATLDNVDVNAATRRGIVVMNTPGVNDVSIVEHTLGMILAAHRHIAQATDSMKNGLWEKKKFQGREIAGSVLGVVGLGKIAGLVALKASRGLRMEVLGYDPAATTTGASVRGVKPVELDELLTRSDVISVHLPSRGLIDKDAIAKMKQGVILVNCARPGIIDEAALLDALNSGKVYAAALDVISDEAAGTALISHPHVVSTPRLAASTEEMQLQIAVSVIEQVVDYFERGIVRNSVNVMSLDAGDLVKLGPYMDLARRLGQFIGLLTGHDLRAVEVEYRGDPAMDLQPITNAVLAGLLSGVEGGDVNVVNAGIIAESRGIRVSETTFNEGAGYGPSLEVRITLHDGTQHSVQGALLRRVGREPRIIGIDEFITEAAPYGPTLVVENRDVPGMIAGMSSALAAGRVNIAQMNLSRDCVGGKAMSIINLDTPADEATLGRIRSIDGILSVRQVLLDP